MLRVIASRNAKEYFAESLKREDYYSEGQEISGDWNGMAAERLGLSGTVGFQPGVDLNRRFAHGSLPFPFLGWLNSPCF